MKSAAETNKLIVNNLILNFMKKLNILQIKKERIISNDELKKLNGGYDGEGCTCLCIPGGYLPSATRDCGPECYYAFGTTAGYCIN